MNRNKLKTYAPQARRDFIQAVTDRAAQFGLTATKTEPMAEQGEVVLIGGQPFPKVVGKKRQKLAERITKLGFGQTMEAMAYTWFNRLVAIRFMELHGYLEHGFRVLSHPEGHPQPEILEHAQDVDLPGLDKQKVVALKLDGTKEDELYRLLLTAQCNALHKAMPFLFESIDDETELLLPDHLLHSDSLIRHLVNEIPEEDWQEVEIIGWLYQFYISEKKDEVIGKVVKSEDIPAATQLFTPNWIVKYLVQNTLGRQWLATYPQSALRQQMQYYIEPAEQTPEVQSQLKAITPTSLNPEELTLLDPACGSGHILTEAYDLFKAIYQERGYRAKDIPSFILQKNLFGLEIDDRAAQLAAFALMMKARADDRRIFEGDAKPNIVAIQDSAGLNAADITHALNSPILKEPMPPKEMLFEDIEEEKAGLFGKKMMGEKGHVSQADIATLLDLFENAKTFGSLIQIPPKLTAKLREIEQRLNDVLKHGDLTHALARVIRPLLRQAQMLARQYDAVVANPPYMGSKYMDVLLKDFAQSRYPGSRFDTFAMFMQRCLELSVPNKEVAVVVPYVWMFISSYEAFRRTTCEHATLSSLIQLEYNAFEPACVPVCTASFMNASIPAMRGTFVKLSDFKGHQNQAPRTLEAIQSHDCKWKYTASTTDFAAVPGQPIAYWVSDQLRSRFLESPSSDYFFSDGLTKTGDNQRFLRFHWELSKTDVSNPDRYRKCAKGGDARRYFGNNNVVVKWDPDARRHYQDDHVARITPEYLWDREGITWTKLSSRGPTFRLLESGTIAETGGPAIFSRGESSTLAFLGFLSSRVAEMCLAFINPTLNIQTNDVLRLPFLMPNELDISSLVAQAVDIAREDWNSQETAYDFQTCPLVHSASRDATLAHAVALCEESCNSRLSSMKAIEEQINTWFIKAFGLQDKLSPKVADEEITLYWPDREENIKRLVSYAIGCMMGRYSLDKPGLIYAHSGNQGFDASQYQKFPADEDGILPLTEFHWFPDDAASRFEKFITTAWPVEHRDENLKFVADSLGPKKGESPRETIRRYLAADFFKHHLSMYKKRPIYWLFSSGKQRGFQALVYLHRYNEGTLARMRTEYVVPLLGKMKARIDQLTDDIAAANSSQHKKKLETEKSTITKQLAEVQTFEEKLRHSADQRIKLDLDDGVKVNYGKFGDLLAEVKAITGGNADE